MQHSYSNLLFFLVVNGHEMKFRIGLEP
uniref:Uncharacterized protein n=1 Tax=Lepeophtheirus salmonis TaxID=72036 RepID=A0A0K2U329_LEPSM